MTLSKLEKTFGIVVVAKFPIKCPDCKTLFKAKSSYLRHIKQKHSDFLILRGLDMGLHLSEDEENLAD